MVCIISDERKLCFGNGWLVGIIGSMILSLIGWFLILEFIVLILSLRTVITLVRLDIWEINILERLIGVKVFNNHSSQDFAFGRYFSLLNSLGFFVNYYRSGQCLPQVLQIFIPLDLFVLDCIEAQFHFSDLFFSFRLEYWLEDFHDILFLFWISNKLTFEAELSGE